MLLSHSKSVPSPAKAEEVVPNMTWSLSRLLTWWASNQPIDQRSGYITYKKPVPIEFVQGVPSSFSFLAMRMRPFEWCCGFEEIGGFLNLPADWTFARMCAKACYDIRSINVHAGVVATTTENQPQTNKILAAIGFKAVSESVNWNTGLKVTLWHLTATR